MRELRGRTVRVTQRGRVWWGVLEERDGAFVRVSGSWYGEITSIIPVGDDGDGEEE